MIKRLAIVSGLLFSTYLWCADADEKLQCIPDILDYIPLKNSTFPNELKDYVDQFFKTLYDYEGYDNEYTSGSVEKYSYLLKKTLDLKVCYYPLASMLKEDGDHSVVKLNDGDVTAIRKYLELKHPNILALLAKYKDISLKGYLYVDDDFNETYSSIGLVLEQNNQVLIYPLGFSLDNPLNRTPSYIYAEEEGGRSR
jgi:hypothetical protein